MFFLLITTSCTFTLQASLAMSDFLETENRLNILKYRPIPMVEN